jgi:hypothetical protein
VKLGEEDRFKKLRAVQGGRGWIEDAMVREERKKKLRRDKMSFLF